MDGPRPPSTPGPPTSLLDSYLDRKAAVPDVHVDLARARAAVVEAELVPHPADRYLAAHTAALQVAVVVLAHRSRPGRVRSSGPRNTWAVVAEVAPELAEWAAFFATTEPVRELVAAGVRRGVTARQADDLVRDADTFLAVVERRVRHRREWGAATSGR